MNNPRYADDAILISDTEGGLKRILDSVKTASLIWSALEQKDHKYERA